LLANVFDPNAQFTNYVYYIGGPEVLALSVTVSGASADNGIFGSQDFDRVEWQPNGTLQLAKQLVGQPTVNQLWGTPLAGLGGDFNLFGIFAFAPRGVASFELASAGGKYAVGVDGGRRCAGSRAPIVGRTALRVEPGCSWRHPAKASQRFLKRPTH
jgi:hypothetical protein